MSMVIVSSINLSHFNIYLNQYQGNGIVVSISNFAHLYTLHINKTFSNEIKFRDLDLYNIIVPYSQAKVTLFPTITLNLHLVPVWVWF